MKLTDAIASYREFVRGEYSRGIPTTDSELVRNALLYILANPIPNLKASSERGEPSAPVNGTITTSAADLITANTNRTAVIIHNHSDRNPLKIHCGYDASSTSGLFVLQPEGTLSIEGSLAKLRINAIATDGNPINYTVIEFLESSM